MIKLESKTLEEFSKEIHSFKVQQNVRSFSELEKITLEWLQENVITKQLNVEENDK